MSQILVKQDWEVIWYGTYSLANSHQYAILKKILAKFPKIEISANIQIISNPHLQILPFPQNNFQKQNSKFPFLLKTKSKLHN